MPTYDRFSAAVAQNVYAPFSYIGQEDPTLLPEGYADGFQDPLAVIQALLLTCNASSGAPQLLADVFSSQSGEEAIRATSFLTIFQT